jgi:hypothetical protein
VLALYNKAKRVNASFKRRQLRHRA